YVSRASLYGNAGVRRCATDPPDRSPAGTLLRIVDNGLKFAAVRFTYFLGCEDFGAVSSTCKHRPIAGFGQRDHIDVLSLLEGAGSPIAPPGPDAVAAADEERSVGSRVNTIESRVGALEQVLRGAVRIYPVDDPFRRGTRVDFAGLPNRETGDARFGSVIKGR